MDAAWVVTDRPEVSANSGRAGIAHGGCSAHNSLLIACASRAPPAAVAVRDEDNTRPIRRLQSRLATTEELRQGIGDLPQPAMDEPPRRSRRDVRGRFGTLGPF